MSLNALGQVVGSLMILSALALLVFVGFPRSGERDGISSFEGDAKERGKSR